MAATNSSSRKRTFQQFDSEDSQISIRLAADAAGAPPLLADRHLLLAVSACARGLAPDAAEWDLSHFVIEGQAVSREAVVAWLHLAHGLIHQEPYAGEAQQDPPLARSAAGLAQLLAFADAVGSSRGLLTACLPERLDSLQFHVQAGEQELRLDATGMYGWGTINKKKLVRVNHDSTVTTVTVVERSETKVEVEVQFAQQLEVLLYLAHKLQAQRLVDLLHACVWRHHQFTSSLLRAQSNLDTVLSARVLDAAAAGPGRGAQLAYVNSTITRPCAFVARSFCSQVLQPVDLTPEQLAPIKFKAVAPEGFLAAGPGQTVDVELDLFRTSKLVVDGLSIAVQLMVGRPFKGLKEEGQVPQ